MLIRIAQGMQMSFANESGGLRLTRGRTWFFGGCLPVLHRLLRKPTNASNTYKSMGQRRLPLHFASSLRRSDPGLPSRRAGVFNRCGSNDRGLREARREGLAAKFPAYTRLGFLSFHLWQTVLQ